MYMYMYRYRYRDMDMDINMIVGKVQCLLCKQGFRQTPK